MPIYIVKIKKDKLMEVRVIAKNKKEARLKVENNDYDPIGDTKEIENGGWEIVDVRKEKEEIATGVRI